MLPCPAAQEAAPVRLLDFRSLEPFPGPQHPPAYQLRYACARCEDLHMSLMTQQQLDMLPLQTEAPDYYDLMVGRFVSATSMRKSWMQSLLRNHWPLNLHCYRHCRRVGGWPSLLRSLAPVQPGEVMVGFSCPSCEQMEYNRLPEGQVQLSAWR